MSLGNKDFGLKLRAVTNDEVQSNLETIAKRINELEWERNSITRELKDLRASREYWEGLNPNQIRLL